MRVSPINNAYLQYSLINNKKTKSTAPDKISNVSFGNITSYKEAFERALRTPVRNYGDFQAIYKSLQAPLKSWVLTRHEDFGDDFDCTMLAVNRVTSLLAGKDKEILFAEEYNWGPVLAYINPKEKFITFLPPNNDYKLNQGRSHNTYISFALLGDGHSFARPKEYMEFWESTGKLREKIDYSGNMILKHKFYKQDGSENTLKNFFMGT